MACSRPITIPNPAVRFKEYRHDTIVVPCGKCMSCLKAKQDSLAVRCQNEAEKRGSMCFVTLTYNDENIPLVSTLWKVDTLSGELERLTEPDFVASSTIPDTSKYRILFSSILASSKPRYKDFSIPQFSAFEDNVEYFYRITPSVCREDVRLWLKRSRMRYQRTFGSPLPQFTYCCVPEYGPRTCRPHYHIAFFGLSEKDCTWLCEQWKFGFYDLKYVKRINADGSDGFAAAGRYIGKYMSKGVFECESVKECSAEKPRVCSSKNLGDNFVTKVTPYVLCYDLFGPYNVDTLVKQSGESLSRLQVDKLVNEIPKRLVLCQDGVHHFALPRVFRNRIFYVKEFYGVENTPIFRPSKLWSLVASNIRSQYDDLHRREFLEFCSSNSERTAAENVAFFAHMQESAFQTKERVGSESLRQFYAKSVY